MKLFTKPQMDQLLENGHHDIAGADHMPVVKLFTPDANCTWILTEIDPECPELAFGLCDLGLGFPELGYVSMTELSQLRGRLRLPVERDLHFEAKYPISVYHYAAWMNEAITEDENKLAQAAQKLSEEDAKSKGPQPT